MVLEDVEDPSSDGLMGSKKISTTSVLETGKISPLTVPDGGVVLSRPRPTLGCSAHDDDEGSEVTIFMMESNFLGSPSVLCSGYKELFSQR
jgi:hypothetical protein